MCFLQSRNYALAGSFLPTFASMNRIFTSNSGSHSTLANHPDFHLHIFIIYLFLIFHAYFQLIGILCYGISSTYTFKNY